MVNENLTRDASVLEEFLRCPKSQSSLLAVSDALISTDPECRFQYEFLDGIPNMFIDEATELPMESWKSIMQENGLDTSINNTASASWKSSKKPRIAFYDSLGEGEYEKRRYGTAAQNLYLETRNTTLEKIIKASTKGDQELAVLEVACGTGLTLRHTVRSLEGRGRFIALDASRTMLSEASSKDYNGESVGFVRGIVPGLPFSSGSFDVVYATRFIYGFSHEDKKLVVEELKTLLRPGGVLVVEFYARNLRRRLRYAGRPQASNKVYSRGNTFKEVREIMGSDAEFFPLQLIANGKLCQITGQSVVRQLTKVLGNCLPLVSKFFAAIRK